MKCLLLFILAGSAVKCDESNYFVVEMTEDHTMDSKKPFQVYWNVPTMQCRSKKIPFEDLYEKFGIIQNTDDSFRGNAVSILYDPGLFPALLKNESSGEYSFRNGGVPQEGSLEKHLEVFRKDLEQGVPEDFSGVGIIDFESWRPIFRQNFGSLVPYKDVSIEIEKKLHWWWPKHWVQSEAIQRFEVSAKSFMQTTLSVAKQMRPSAVWGYYGFPYCYNMAANNMKETCAKNVPEENDRLDWLWSESTALYPSIYSSKELTSSQLFKMIRGRLKEADRVNRNGVPILPYFWFRYRDGGYLSEEDLNAALKAIYSSSASGFILWGSSNDVNTVDKCNKLHKYIENTLGPAVAKYTKVQLKNIPEDNIKTTTAIPSTSSVNFDPDYYWDPPENYEQNIKKYVDNELKNKAGNDSEEITLNNQNSVLIDLVLNNFVKHENDVENDNVESEITTVVDDDTSPIVDDNTSATVDNDDTSENFDHDDTSANIDQDTTLTTVDHNDTSTTVVIDDNTTTNTEKTTITDNGNLTTVVENDKTTETDNDKITTVVFNDKTTITDEIKTTTDGNNFKFFNEDTFNDFIVVTDDNIDNTTDNIVESETPELEMNSTTGSTKSQVVVLNK